jgi:hypothetical protein
MDSKSFFEDEDSIFKYKINKLLKKEELSDIVTDIIKIHLLRGEKNVSKYESKKKLYEIYELLGTELFFELITLINGDFIDFPSIEDLKDIINIAISYYYSDKGKRNWEEIRYLLEEDKLNSIKYGINIKYLRTEMNKLDNEFELTKRKEDGVFP